MKKVVKKLVIVVMCLALFTGIGVSGFHPLPQTTGSKIVTVQAKAKINKKFKKAMDEYYNFYKKYCKFMKKYKKSKGGMQAITMLNDYNKLLIQQRKFNASFKKWKKKSLNSAEVAYYTKINARVLAMLAKV